MNRGFAVAFAPGLSDSERDSMRILLAAVACLALGAASPAWAKKGGCLKYGAVGAVAGHMVGKGHGVAGAVAGCAMGAHARHKAEEQQHGNKSAHQGD